MLDQFSNLNSLEYALTGHEFMENLEMDVPKMDFATGQPETATQPSNERSTKSSKNTKDMASQQNILVS